MKILIIEDEEKLRDELKVYLKNNGYIVEVITSFENTLEKMISFDGDLILLDINLPNVNGQFLCKEYRKNSSKPIIIVTSRNNEMDELICMNYGADDFVTKPYNKYILLDKIRRALKLNDPVRYKELKVHDVTLDLHLSKVRFQDKEVELTRNEFRILYYLFLNVGVVLSKEKLIEFLWNDQYYLDETILLVNINRLRKKLEDIDLSDLVKTKRGVGYFI